MTLIRPYIDSDRHSLVELIWESDVYHHTLISNKTEIERSLVRVPEGVEILVAADGNQITGFASFSTLYPAAVGRPQLFLKELFVSQKHHRKNVGKKLMSALLQLAIKRGYTRIDWTTEEDNHIARAFYEKIGASPVKKLFYRLENDDLIAASKNLE
jgi:GNAT superfamily N-acetyltransferase